MQSLQKTFCPRNELDFDPEKWCRRLGNKCQVCQVDLTHQKCLSLCRCYFFCHQSCFTSSYQPQLNDQQVDIKCINCQQVLKIGLDATYKYSPSKSFVKIGKIALVALLQIFNVIGIVLTLNNVLKPDLSFFLLYLQGLVLSLLLYLLIIYVRDLLYVKVVKIKEVISTKLEIQTSAFKDLDMHTNEELTKDELIFTSKKSKM